jgi:hypothetical protein
MQRAGGCVSPGDRAHAVPMVEATTVVGWCGLARQARHGSAVVEEHATAVRAQRRWRGRPAGGVVETEVCGGRGGADHRASADA